MTTYTLQITKAVNGWVVRAAVHGELAEPFVVAEDEKLSEMIAAAIVAGKLTDDETLQKLASQQAVANTTIRVGSVHSGWLNGTALTATDTTAGGGLVTSGTTTADTGIWRMLNVFK